MLAVSVFGHLFFLTVLMFLPQSKVILEKIEPVFMVDLIELPGGMIDRDKTPVATAPVSEPTTAEPVETAPKPGGGKTQAGGPTQSRIQSATASGCFQMHFGGTGSGGQVGSFKIPAFCKKTKSGFS